MIGTATVLAARFTLGTMYAHFVTGGFRHEAAWNA